MSQARKIRNAFALLVLILTIPAMAGEKEGFVGGGVLVGGSVVDWKVRERNRWDYGNEGVVSKETSAGGGVGGAFSGSIRYRDQDKNFFTSHVGTIGMGLPMLLFAASKESVIGATSPEFAKTCAAQLSAALTMHGTLSFDFTRNLPGPGIPAIATGDIQPGARVGLICRIPGKESDYVAVSGTVVAPVSQGLQPTLGANVTFATGKNFATLSVNGVANPFGNDNKTLSGTLMLAHQSGDKVYAGVTLAASKRLDDATPAPFTDNKDGYKVEEKRDLNLSSQLVVGTAF